MTKPAQDGGKHERLSDIAGHEHRRGRDAPPFQRIPDCQRHQGARYGRCLMPALGQQHDTGHDARGRPEHGDIDAGRLRPQPNQGGDEHGYPGNPGGCEKAYRARSYTISAHYSRGR